MPEKDKPIGNPRMVLREESDDWAILYDPETGGTFGLDPVSVFIWKRLDGDHTREQIFEELKQACPEAPPEASDHIKAFIKQLEENGLLLEEPQEVQAP